jgi:drug/metabolite transporter (DMT)-like permease
MYPFLKNKYVMLFIALLAVSSSAWVVRLLPDLSSTTIAFWRMFLASIMAFIVSYKTILTFVPNKKILVAGLFLGFHFALFFRSVQLTSIAEAALLGTISPVFTEIYSLLFQKKSFSLRVFFGLFLALFGAFVLINQSSFSSTSTTGNLLAVLCSIAMAAVLLIGKDVRKKVGLFEYSRWIFLYASVCLFIISYFENVSVLEFQNKDFGWFVFLAAIPTMVGHNIFYFLVKSLSATTVAAVPLGEPVISSIGAFFFFGEPVDAFVFFGGFITLLGVYFVIKYGD